MADSIHISSNEAFGPEGNPMLKMFDEIWTSLGDIGKGAYEMFNPEMPKQPELPEVPEAPEAPTPVELGEEGIRKGSMERIAKKQRSLYAITRGQPRADEMTLGGIRKTLA